MIDIKDVALSTLLKVHGCAAHDTIPDDHSPTGLRHVEDMLDAIINGKVGGEKAHRWLGWAQAIICVAGGATLEELKEINKGL